MLRKSSGFSLIEMMVAMVIALVVMAGVVNSFLASKDAFHYNEELAFIQENARFASGKFGTDIREAGSFGCHDDSPDTVSSRNNYRAGNLINALGDTSAMGTKDMFKAYGLQGYNATTTYPSFITASYTPVANSDVVIVRHADMDNALAVQGYVAPLFSLAAATPNTSFSAGTILVYSDAQCRYQAIFQSGGPSPVPPATQSTITLAGAASPGNFTTSLQGNLFVSTTNIYFGDYAHSVAESSGVGTWIVTAGTYLPDSKIMPLSSNAYFVAPSSIDGTMNALWVSSLGNGGVVTTQELVLGVDDMRIYYGVDTDAAADGVPNRYVKADTIGTNDAATPGTTYNYLVWNRVASVRIQLLLRSRGKISSNPSQSFRWDDGVADFTKNDGYLRQMVSFTVQLRNPFRG